MFRLNIPVLNEQLEMWNRENEGKIFTESSKWPLLSLCGYHTDFGQNLAVLIGLTAIHAVILAILAEISIPRKGVRRCSAWVYNFSLRFIYELLLGFSLSHCVCEGSVHLRADQESQSLVLDRCEVTLQDVRMTYK